MKRPEFFRVKLPAMMTAILILLSVRGYSQEKDFRYYDSLSYGLYTLKDWKSLIAVAEEAESKGYDYYYLNMRLGIAHYEMKDYRSSIPYFEKSLEYSTDEPAAVEYLYFAYLESGRSGDASMLAAKYREKLASVPGTGSKILNFIYTEGGYTPDAASRLTPSALMGNDSIYGEEDAFKTQSYFHLGVQLQPLPFLKVYASGSMLGIGKQKHFAFANYNASGNFLSVTDTVFPYSYNQKEFYIAASLSPYRGFTITPALHVMQGDPSPVNCIYSDYTYSFSEDAYSYSHYVFSLLLTKELRKFTLGVSGSVSKLTPKGRQYQASASLTWYPKGNLDIYTTSIISVLRENKKTRLIYDQTVGLKMAPKLWLEGSATVGDLAYFNEKNAFVVYNLPEHIVFRGGASLIYMLNRHLDVSLMYRLYSRENDYLYYSYDPDSGRLISQTRKNAYVNQSFFGGLKWKF